MAIFFGSVINNEYKGFKLGTGKITGVFGVYHKDKEDTTEKESEEYSEPETGPLIEKDMN